MDILIYTVVLLGLLGFLGAVVLYATAKRFHVEEDPRIDVIASELAGANCGGCGFKGCRDFASACVSRGSLEGLFCPVSGADGMKKIATILGVAPVASERRIAVLRCKGDCKAREEKFVYDGAMNCRVMAAVAVGTRGCSYGCLGCGDCVSVCRFGAIAIDRASGLPVVDSAKCTACGACVAECPRSLLELRPEGRATAAGIHRRVWVACANRERGALAIRTCKAACIGCGKCLRSCPFGAINISDNLAYIDPAACKACGKCAAVCPTGAIRASFEIPKPAKEGAPC